MISGLTVDSNTFWIYFLYMVHESSPFSFFCMDQPVFPTLFIKEIVFSPLYTCWEPAHEIPPMTRSWGENLRSKVDQDSRDSEKASTRDPTHDKVIRRKPDKQSGSGFQGFQKAVPGTHLKDDICLSDACSNRLLPNFCDTGRRPSPISFQIRINLEL